MIYQKKTFKWKNHSKC